MKIRNMTRCGLMAAMLAVCGWIAVPLGDISVSLQTLGVLLCLGVLGGRLGSVAILVYLSLGALGAPVFTGFQGGFAVLLGPTGGYLWGFLLVGAVYLLVENKLPLWLCMVLCQLIIYINGTIWYFHLYAQGGLWAIILKCVVPYLVPDGLKLLLALHLTSRIRR
ncbi:MAG: biotin transporter BioY [Oscillospiraceae bacterium]|nr:biotin transporter BioY [Oscillospiraceae bacterium]